MNKKVLLLAGIGAALLLLVYPAVMAMSVNTSDSTTSKAINLRSSVVPSPPSLTVGQTFTFSSTNGQYRIISGAKGSGTASGTITFSVTQTFRCCYTLSITSGSITINGTTYTITSGSAQMGKGLAHIVGQGTTSDDGAFIFTLGAHANLFGQQYDLLRLDFKVNNIEYGVVLLVGQAST